MSETNDSGGGKSGRAEAKAAHWCSMLLDFSRRNRLLNFKEGPGAIELAMPLPDTLEDGLSDSRTFRIEADPPPDGQSAEKTAEECSKGVVRAKNGGAAALKRLQGLLRAARTDLEEGGARTLFVVLGTLRWKDGKGDRAPVYRAPLVMCPVELKRVPGAPRFELKRADADTAGNTTLLEMVRREHGIAVQGVEPLPEDEHGVDVRAVLDAWKSAVAALDGWSVEPEVWIGRFSFAKFLLWKDLSEHLEALSGAPVVAHLLDGGGAFDDGTAPVEPRDLAGVADAELPLCPLAADSSQLAAVVAAVRGRSFVLFGPPGTGKSQTIANLVAASMAAGKSVLFVAEKRAALEVVERRLRKIGLAPFCLELHSNKAGKTDVLRQLRKALDYAGAAPPEQWDAALAAMSKAKEGLDRYVRALHEPHPCGLTPYAAFSFVMERAGDAEKLGAAGALDDLPLETTGFSAAAEAAARLAEAARDVPPDAFRALGPVRAAEWSPSWQAALVAAAAPVPAMAEALGKAALAAAPGAAWRDSEARLEALLAAEAEPWWRRLPRRRRARKALVEAAAGAGGGAKAAAEALVEAWRAWRPVAAEFCECAGIRPGTDPALVAAAAAFAAENPAALRAWCRWRAAAEPCENAGLAPIVEAVRSGALAPGDAVEATRYGYCEKFARAALDKSETLRSFFGNGQDSLVKTFCALDKRVCDLSRQMVAAKLSLALLRAKSDPALAKERAALARETAKKTRIKPVRQILDAMPGLLPVLKPCLLMSPLSVAQFLPAASRKFDMVVFDEASQLSTWDAVGALARGRQAIIVGDPKQLPPTSFFQKASGVAGEEDETDGEDAQDLESILDECKVCGIPEQELRWHYRSRHESLISFSNERYYGGTLFTFPSAAPVRSGLGVRRVLVEGGVYDRARTRTNRKEAEAVVAAAVERLLDPAFAGKTCGIVTFSMAQQSLIEDLLDDEQAKHPEIQRFFDPALPEPFFVKNLENVQGDERDAIFFSIGYAPDETGAFPMNFGPLNRPGGERRLNVAVTRAKEEVVVFVSFESPRIDLSRSAATGVAHLREFLAAAERAGARPGGGAGGEAPRDAFVRQVAQFVESRGFEVEYGVGHSAYRIDIGVRKAGGDGSFALGIECDGAMYRDAATARDRDESRRGVLQGLGWRMVRCWCLEWWFDRAKAEQKLAAALDAAARGEDPPEPEADVAAALSSATAAAGGAALAAAIGEAKAAADPFERVYEPAAIDTSYSRAQSNFREKWASRYLGPQILRIVNAEGPIVEDLLLSRVLEEWGWKIATEDKAKIIRKAVPDTIKTTAKAHRRVYWPVGADPAAWETYRRPGASPRSRRALKLIPQEELAAAFAAAMRALGPDAADDALREDALRRLGIDGTRRLSAEDAAFAESALKAARRTR